jgi:hypothetical protein
LSEALRDQLAKFAPEIIAVKADIEPASHGTYFELEIRSFGYLTGGREEEPCQVCGSQNVVYPKETPQIRDVPDLPLFRLTNTPTLIVAHESLLPFFRRGLESAVTFRPVRVVP